MSYTRSCGPLALAELAELSPMFAARLLLQVAIRAGHRPDKRTTRMVDLLEALRRAGYDPQPVDPYRVTPSGRREPYQLATFARLHPTGRYLVATWPPGGDQHACALMDGRLRGARSHEHEPVEMACRLHLRLRDGDD